MNTTTKIVIACVAFIVLIAAGFFLLGRGEPQTITSFDECVAAGYPVLDTYPEQCETPDGERFMREISENELSPEVLAHIQSKSDLIVVDAPQPLAQVSSPLMIRGEARGTWYFEADFPVRIEDANGVVLGQHYATAQGDWMTEAFVPFESELSFSTPTAEAGTLVLEKDNPSGLAEHANELRLPVRFVQGNIVPPQTDERTVSLYYYNPSFDEDENGNIMCSEEGLVAVKRTIPVTQTPIQDTIHLLLRGELTAQEEAQGITTEYPLNGFTLTGASLTNGVLTLSFNDPNNQTVGGSCRAGVLWSQISKTARQFDVVTEVQFQPEELFQP